MRACNQADGSIHMIDSGCEIMSMMGDNKE